jgi:Family of unknown function (DUF6527)
MVNRMTRRLGGPAPVDLIPGAIRVSGRADLPRRLRPGRLYLVGEPAKWAVFRCPCGTGHQIDLNLAHVGRPRWSVEFDPRNRPSLRPSVDVRAERRCHFWLTSGQVRWCQDATGMRTPGHVCQLWKRQLAAVWRRRP